jgi:hypothetical protein
MNDKQKEFQELTYPLIKWLCENYHPHVSIIVTPTHAEVLEGLMAVATTEFVRD